MPKAYIGNCHCQNLQWQFHTKIAAREWDVRSCQCSFCRAHGACCTTDPGGTVKISIDNGECLLRYRFALSAAQFLVCKICGVYIGATMTHQEACFATINLNTMIKPPSELPEPTSVCYDEENLAKRIERRRIRWTPATIAL